MVYSTTILSFLATSSTAAELTLSSVDYSDGNHTLQGFLALPKITPAPGVVVILPDWDGVNDYEKKRAVMVATELGYVAFAADIYGADLHEVTDFNEKIRLSTLYRGNTTLFISRIQAAVDLVTNGVLDETESNSLRGSHNGKVGVIGYCLGGTGALLYALSGVEDADAFVSLHGGLLDFEVDPLVQPKLLVLSGGEDDTATKIRDLEVNLDTTNTAWEITRYSDVYHGFTAFESQSYDAWADARSWGSMSNFLKEAFGIEQFDGGEPDKFTTVSVNYEDVDGTKLRGYLALPKKDIAFNNAGVATPIVVIFPDWDGVNAYEKLRATMLADAGYIAFAADIYGEDLQEDLTFQQCMTQSTLYREDQPLYAKRMQAAIDTVRSNVENVYDNPIAIIGYCFGGSGVVQYAFSGATDAAVAVAFHGGLQTLPVPEPKIHARVLVLSGGMDDAHGNQTELEMALNGRGDAGWEITRYAGVKHGFTAWGTPNYNLLADARSWEAMMTVFDEMFSNIAWVPSSSATPTATPTSSSPHFHYASRMLIFPIILRLVYGFLE